MDIKDESKPEKKRDRSVGKVLKKKKAAKN
jgi:hypothetical protein